MIRRLVRATALSGAAGLLLVSAATGATAHSTTVNDGVIDSGKATHAHDLQHGEEEGHLAPVGPTGGLKLLSKLGLKNVEPGKVADVGVLKDHAYLAAWGGQTCRYNGIHVVDIRNLSAPKEVAFIQAKEGSYAGEGVQALPISTASFKGDILVTNNEICKGKAGFGGVNIYNVTNPAHPTPLTEGYGDDATAAGADRKNAHEIHSVFAWQGANNKAYAAIVDNEESEDVDILDISNPKKPQLIAEYDLAKAFPGIVQKSKDLDEVFLHDLVVKTIGGKQVMLASYWDAGYVQLDVTDPRKIKLINDSDFTNPDPEAAESGLGVPAEGNGHQAEFTKDNRFVLGADEDFGPYALLAKNLTDGTEVNASQGSGTTKLLSGQTITGPSVFVGRACNTDAAVPAGTSGVQVAVVERGVCAFTEKVANVIKAGGYEAVLIFNRTASDGCDSSLSMNVDGAIPTFGVAPRSQGFALFNQPYDNTVCLAGDGTQTLALPLGTVGDTLTFASYFDGWGYVHLFARGAAGGKMAELDTYAVPEAHDPAFADGFGDLSVHEVATSQKKSSVAYVSYYAAGLRVIEVDSSNEIVEKAKHIDAGGNNFWGVETFMKGGKEYVAASDRDLGLYLYEYTPVNAP